MKTSIFLQTSGIPSILICPLKIEYDSGRTVALVCAMDRRFILRDAQGSQDEDDQEMPWTAVVKSNGQLPIEVQLDAVVLLENIMVRTAWRKPRGSLPEAHLAEKLAGVELVFTVASPKR